MATDMDTDQEPDADLEKRVAERMLARLTAHEALALEQFGSMGKWLMASLLAINSAGAFAILSDASSAPFDRPALILFGFGIGAALLSGTTMQDVYQRFPTSLMIKERYWLKVARTGERDPEVEAQDDARIGKITRWNFLPPALGWVSAGFWIAGALQLAFQVL